MLDMTYEQMCDFEVLYRAYLTARKRKRKKAGTAEYEANALACTDKLSRILSNKTYKPSKFEVFYVYEPKQRLVQAPAFVDKVVLHALTDNVLYEAITKSFIRDNYASQIDKGTHDALMRLKMFMVEYYRQYHTTEGWVLKCDVHHFFASIDHEMLKAKLKTVLDKRGVDPDFFELLCVYIDTTEGLPLGYQTSQLLALMYLDDFDHTVKEKFRIRAFGRFMDDFMLIHPDKGVVQEVLAKVKDIMNDKLLELNQKTGIFPLRNGIDFLGFHTYMTETGGVVQKLRRENVNRIRGKVKKWRAEYAEGKITKEKIKESFTAWDAFAAFGDTYSIRRKYADQVEDIIGEKIEIQRKINSTKKARAMRKLKQEKAIYKKTHPEQHVLMLPEHAAPGDGDDPPWE